MLRQGGLTCIEGPPGPPDKGEGTLVKDGVQDVGRVPVSVAAEHGLPVRCLGSLQSPNCVNKQRRHLYVCDMSQLIKRDMQHVHVHTSCGATYMCVILLPCSY